MCQLLEQGKEKEARELLAVLEWVAAGDEATAPAAAPAPPAQPASAAPSARAFTPAQALQIEEATALMHQVSRRLFVVWPLLT